MVPIYQQPATISDEQLAEETAILESEGRYHVAGVYYANQADAALQRRWEAERRIRERARQQRLACAFCNSWIEKGVEPVSIAGRYCHPHCAESFADWMASTPEANDPRWATVNDSTPVTFDGCPTTWGELANAERHTCEWSGDRLVGGYGR